MRWFTRLVSIVALVAGCKESALSTPAAENVSDVTMDAGLDAPGVDDSTPTRIALGPTSSSLETDFALTIAGRGSNVVGAFSFTNNVGTVEIDGATLPAFIYERQPFESKVLYQFWAVAPDRLWILWLYVDIDDDGNVTMTDVFHESTAANDLADEPATGQGSETHGSYTASIALPAFDIPIPPNTPIRFKVDGDGYALSGTEPGTFVHGKNTFRVYPFQVIGNPRAKDGDLQLHALYVDEQRSKVCFGILYLLVNRRFGSLQYSICLPGLDDIDGDHTVDWSILK